MYFNTNKENTNIDSEFKEPKKFQFNIKYLLIGIGIIAMIGIIILVINLINGNNVKYSITLEGDTYLTIYEGNDYVEPGYSGSDSKGNDITGNIIVNNQINTNTPGNYEVTYSINNISKTRYITVTEKPVGATYIYLKGDLTVYLKPNETYNEPGYIVIDTIDSNLSNKIKISNNLNSKKAGTYRIVYSVINSSGVTTSASRTVIVIDNNISLNASPTAYTNGSVDINVVVSGNYFDYMILPNGTKANTNTYTYKVSENGTYNFKVYTTKGGTKESSIKINNIDKIAPTGTCTLNINGDKSNIVIQASDNIGISKYSYNNKEYTTTTINTGSGVKTANITIYDKAGNSKNITCATKSKEKLEIHFIKISTGRYDGILFRLGNKTLFVDGAFESNKSTIDKYLKAIGVDHIDIIVGSHGHYNHVDIQGALIRDYNVKEAYYNQDIYHCVSCESNVYKKIIAALNEKHITAVETRPGYKFSLGDVTFDTIGSWVIQSYPNNYSSTYIVSYQGRKIMLTGDGIQEGEILKHYTKEQLKVDIFKYPHHGGPNIGAEFASAIQPEYVVVPNACGSYNVPETTKKRFGSNTKYYQHCKDGNIVIIIDGEGKITVKTQVDPTTYKLD